jgi:hypothetical protein
LEDGQISGTSAMTNNERLDETVTIELRMDEAIVLLWYLSREALNRGSSHLEPYSTIQRRVTGYKLCFRN